MSKGYSIPLDAKVELFRSILEARHSKFTYALFSESPTDTGSIKSKPWTVLCVNFLLDEQNSAVWNAILKHTPNRGHIQSLHANQELPQRVQQASQHFPWS